MIADYLITNYLTLIIMLVLAATMFTNRGFSIPSSSYFNIIAVLVIAVTFFEYLDLMTQGITLYTPEALSLNDRIIIRTVACTAMYMIRPFIILLEIIAVVPGRRNHLLLSVPAVFNALFFLPAAFGASFVFWIDENNHWQATPLRFTVYVVQLFYVLLLFAFSIYYFKKNNSDLSIIAATIVILSFSVSFLEKKRYSQRIYHPCFCALCSCLLYIPDIHI